LKLLEIPQDHNVSDLESESHERSVSVVNEEEIEDEITPIIIKVPTRGLMKKNTIQSYSQFSFDPTEKRSSLNIKTDPRV
jgi:hypothetical protein